MRLRVGQAGLSRPRGDARAPEGAGPAHLRVDQPLHRPDARRSSTRAGARAICSSGPTADVWQWDRWQAGMGVVDFTNPAACALVRRQAARPGAIWASTASRPTSASASPPTSSTSTAPTRCKMHNYYTLSLQPDGLRGAGREARQRRAPSVRALGHHGRPAVPRALGRRLHGHLRVDGRDACAAACRWGCPASASGATISAASSSTATADLYKRWCAFGLLSSHSRLHGSSSYRVPWLFDEEAVEVLRYFTRLKCRLMPYLYARRARGRTCAARP